MQKMLIIFVLQLLFSRTCLSSEQISLEILGISNTEQELIFLIPMENQEHIKEASRRAFMKAHIGGDNHVSYSMNGKYIALKEPDPEFADTVEFITVFTRIVNQDGIEIPGSKIVVNGNIYTTGTVAEIAEGTQNFTIISGLNGQLQTANYLKRSEEV